MTLKTGLAHGSGGSDQKALLAGNHASAVEARRQKKIQELADFILKTYYVTVDGMTLEYTSDLSPIVPVAVVSPVVEGCKIAGVVAEAGPGQTVDGEWLTAFEQAAWMRLTAGAARKAGQA